MTYSNAQSLVEEFVCGSMPEGVRRDLSRVNADLLFGPMYFDETGEEERICFAPDAVAFDFSAACSRVSGWLDDLDDLTVLGWVPEVVPAGSVDEDTCLYDAWENIDFDRAAINAALMIEGEAHHIA